MVLNQFQKSRGGFKGGCFKCELCGKMTRKVDDNTNLPYCKRCELEGEIACQYDNGEMTDEEYNKQMAALDKKYPKEVA